MSKPIDQVNARSVHYAEGQAVEVIDGAIASHDCQQFKELCVREIRGGATQYIHQCLVCGMSVGGAVAKASIPAGTRLRPYDEGLSKRRAVAETVVRDRLKAERDREWMSWYSEYLKSDKWRAKRRAVMTRAGGLCEGCLEASATQVHHLSYENVGDELLFQLVAVCDQCHDRAHAEPRGRP